MSSVPSADQAALAAKTAANPAAKRAADPAASSAAAPRIGLTAYREPARWGVWDETADLLPASYARSVSAAGGLPLLLPPSADDQAGAVLDGLHGLVLAGGADVDPSRYGAEPDPHTDRPRRDRDSWELALARAALARDLPVLAICRGMQVLNVALGGSLIQHLPDRVGTQLHSPTPGRHGRHEVRLAQSSRLHEVIGAGCVVATYHHQAVDVLGDGLVAAGWTDDGVVEAVELPSSRWVIGVQWHPEVTDSAHLFGDFIDACRA
ncbi:MAG TPA: gamma-glutamyl-gamma-aminobutyrate hydrolase family protein [Jatrophihabitans sp.]|nr:gamma-glutamyl-gamma-aminobutyrate hydrolase family protein [Jatrophihabitans sp.]